MLAVVWSLAGSFFKKNKNKNNNQHSIHFLWLAAETGYGGNHECGGKPTELPHVAQRCTTDIDLRL